MVQKRQFDDENGNGFEAPGQESKRRHTFRNDVRDVLRGLTLSEVLSRLEPFLRKVVREEVDRAVQTFLHSSPRTPYSEAGTSRGRRGLELHFLNNLPQTIFTASKLDGENGSPLQIVLYDANSQAVVQSGPLSSAKIKILVIDGEFAFDDQDDWTERDFNKSVVREREGKRPLISGDITVTLKDGIGLIAGIVFTDNSSWIRSRKFRLAARIGQKLSAELRIREARTEPFVVKDHRGEVYKKHHPPYLKDEIWRLERIAKDGAFHKRLASFGIKTVKDFLRLYEMNTSTLRNILGGIADRVWDAIVEHARTCVIDDHNLYSYRNSSHGVCLVFNSIYKVLGATFNGQTYRSLDELDIFQKRLVEDLKQHAYENRENFVPVNEESVATLPSLTMEFSNLVADQFSDPSLGSEQVEFSCIHQDHSLTRALTSYTYDLQDTSHHLISAAQNNHSVQPFPPTIRDHFAAQHSDFEKFDGESISKIGSFGYLGPIGRSVCSDISWCQTQPFPPINTTWEEGRCFLFPSSDGGEISFRSPFPSGVNINMKNGRSKGWFKIWAAVKCGISVRRDAAAKRARNLAAERIARPLYSHY